MNFDHDFVQVWKFSERPKKNKQMEHFFPQIQVKTKKKKKVFIKNRTLFSPNLRLDIHPLKLLGGCRCEPFSNYWGGYSQIIGGDVSPHPPLFRHPCKQWFGGTAPECSPHGAGPENNLIVSLNIYNILFDFETGSLVVSRPFVSIKAD